jgi:chromosome segregation ATPase
MARTNLHELASRLLAALDQSSPDGVFQGKLRSVAAEAGLNSVRSAEAVKLLESLGRIEIRQRGRRGRDTIIDIRSKEPVSLADAEASLPSRAAKRSPRLDYEDLGRAVVDRLLDLAKDDALRTAQVEAFAAERQQLRDRENDLTTQLESASEREADLRIKLRAAEEALARVEENLRRTLEPQSRMVSQSNRSTPPRTPEPVPDDEAKAVLEVLRSGRV